MCNGFENNVYLNIKSIIENETPIFNQHEFIATTVFGLLNIIFIINEL